MIRSDWTWGLSALLAATFFAGCIERFGAKCGPGSRDENGVCVVESGKTPLVCGPGTLESMGTCVPTSTTTGGLSCGEGTVAVDDACVPAPPIPITPSRERMLEFACPSGRCVASRVIEYWTRQVQAENGTNWDAHAVTRTLTFVEVGATPGASFPTYEGLLYRVTDGVETWDCRAGAACPGLEFSAGIPVTLKVRNAAGNLGRHTFTSPRFFRSIAWWRAVSADADYRAPTFDSFNVARSDLDNEITLYFVPMVPGDYVSYCAVAVSSGDRFAEIADGSVSPNLATGHAALGMHVPLVIADPDETFAEATFAQDTLVDRDPALDVDPRRRTPWWTQASENQGNCCLARSIELEPQAESELRYRFEGELVGPDNPIRLREAFGNVLSISNLDPGSRHTFTAPQLFARSILRYAADTQAMLYLPYLTGVQVFPMKQTALSLVPIGVASYEPFCELGVRFGAFGAPDFGTGHAGSGMHGPLFVDTSTAP